MFFSSIHRFTYNFTNGVFSPTAIPEYAYRKVYLTGIFDHAHEILLGPKTRDGQLGFHVITPLIRGDGQDTILVNRGFVNRVHKEQEDRSDSLVRTDSYYRWIFLTEIT